MVTMADVARAAGVSVSTVSHVINGTRFVKEETRQLVLEAIRQTGYVHNGEHPDARAGHFGDLELLLR